MTFKPFSAVFTRSLATALAVTLVWGSFPLRADPTDTSQPPVAPLSDETPAQDEATVPDPAAAQAPTMPPEQIETLVAPIALYPDPLISQILVACTYPLELVQAGQWLQQHPELQGQALKDAAAQQSWDPSVQALVLFPDVIKRLNSDVTWTTNVGNAFLANQASVMDAIQHMRVKAEEAGKLQSSPQEKVTTKTQSGQTVVQIQPADPEVIYVPEYNPVWIWGSPVGYYYPAWYYPPPPPFGVWFLWGPAFRMSLYFPGWIGLGGWGWWGWHPGWHDHAVIVNRVFITNNHFNVVNVRTFNNRAVWVHNPEHRMGVAYPNHALAQRFNAPAPGRQAFARPTVGQVQQQFYQRSTSPGVASERPTVGQVQQQFHQRAISPGATSERLGNRTIMSNAATSNRSAFGGAQHGSTARAYSSRGRTSLGQSKSGGGNKGSGNKGGGGGGNKGGGEGRR
jgi:hypothetical protein